MAIALNRPVSGHVFRVERKQGPVWYAKYRLPDGRQVQKKLGPAWTQRGRPPAGHLTKHTAQAWLDDTLATARRGELAGMVRTGTTFSQAAEEWLRYVENERACSVRRFPVPGFERDHVARRRYGYLVSCGERVAQARSSCPHLLAAAIRTLANGATWRQGRDNFVFKTSSGVITKALNGGGFDAVGLNLDGSGPRESQERSKTLTRL